MIDAMDINDHCGNMSNNVRVNWKVEHFQSIRLVKLCFKRFTAEGDPCRSLNRQIHMSIVHQLVDIQDERKSKCM